MKPFDLASALKGARLCTREGARAQIVFVSKTRPVYSVLAVVSHQNGDVANWYTREGLLQSGKEDDKDLFLCGDQTRSYPDRGGDADYSHRYSPISKVPRWKAVKEGEKVPWNGYLLKTSTLCSRIFYGSEVPETGRIVSLEELENLPK